MKSDYRTINVEITQGVAILKLNNPPVNQLSKPFVEEIKDGLISAFGDHEVKVVILTGTEKNFIAGADITEFGTTPSQNIARQIRWERDLWGQFLGVSKPLIAAIHGFALGAGVEMSMCCDIRIASEDARFGLPEVGLGMVPTAGGTQTMPRLVPFGMCTAPILTGELINAAEALRIGLINRVVTRADLLAAAEETGRKIMSRSQIAVRYAKQAINRGLDLPWQQGLGRERERFAIVLSSE